jgi:hypothetical protein
MKQAPLHGKKFWMNTYGVLVPREECNSFAARRKKPSGQAKQSS